MENFRRRSSAPFVAIFILALIWGYNWVVMKVALTDSPPLFFAALRLLVAASVLFPMMVLLHRPLRLPPLPYIIPYGLIQSSAFIGLSLLALEYGGAGKTAILVYMMPIWLMLLAWPLLGERLHRLQGMAVLLAGLGLLAILRPWDFHGPWKAPIFAILAGFSWAVSAIWHKRYAPPGQDMVNATFWQALIGGGVLVVLAALTEPARIHWSPEFLLALAYNAIPGTAVAYLLWTFALHRLPSGIAGIATLLAPPVGIVTAWAQLGERPGPWETAGMAAILASLALASWQHLRPGDRSTHFPPQE